MINSCFLLLWAFNFIRVVWVLWRLFLWESTWIQIIGSQIHGVCCYANSNTFSHLGHENPCFSPFVRLLILIDFHLWIFQMLSIFNVLISAVDLPAFSHHGGEDWLLSLLYFWTLSPSCRGFVTLFTSSSFKTRSPLHVKDCEKAMQAMLT